jgi:hypothetical protein
MENRITQLENRVVRFFQAWISSLYYRYFPSRFLQRDYQMSYHLLSFSVIGILKLERKMTLTHGDKDKWSSLNEELIVHTNLLQDFTNLPRDVLLLVMEFAAPGDIFSFCLWLTKQNKEKKSHE